MLTERDRELIERSLVLCSTCGGDISPNDVGVIERGIRWVDGKPHHDTCWLHDALRLRAAMKAVAARLRYLADSVPPSELPMELHASAHALENQLE
jgi:hypothetical protein